MTTKEFVSKIYYSDFKVFVRDELICIYEDVENGLAYKELMTINENMLATFAIFSPYHKMPEEKRAELLEMVTPYLITKPEDR